MIAKDFFEAGNDVRRSAVLAGFGLLLFHKAIVDLRTVAVIARVHLKTIKCN
jgi:hypothetical protein